MSSHETPLQRRQRMAETAAYAPFTSGEAWVLEQGTPLWSGQSSHPHLDSVLRTCVDDLPSPMRDVVEMRIWGRFTFEEIARTLHLGGGRGAAHVYFTRGLERLRLELGTQEDL